MLVCFSLVESLLELLLGMYQKAYPITSFASHCSEYGSKIRALSGTVPIYLSEISAPKTRGLIGGLSGVGLSLGTMTANWTGFACGYAPYGSVQWRLPLAIQVPWGIILFIGLATFMPNSPRQLIQKGNVEAARREFIRIRSDLHSHEVHEEFGLMRAQIEYEITREIPSYREIFKLYRHRVLVYVLTPPKSSHFPNDCSDYPRSISVQVLTSVTGVNVIQVSPNSMPFRGVKLLMCY